MRRKRPSTPRPYKRRNPSGRTVWVARYLTRDGRRPSAGTFARKSDAQAAIEEAMEREWSATTHDTFGAYADTWIARHPRSERTNITNASRIRAVRKVALEGVPLEDWRFADLRRRHALELVDRMLRDQGRTHAGAQNILRTLSAMAEDAITDEVIEQVEVVMKVHGVFKDPELYNYAVGAITPRGRWGEKLERLREGHQPENLRKVRLAIRALCPWRRWSGSGPAGSTVAHAFAVPRMPRRIWHWVGLAGRSRRVDLPA